MEACRVCAFHAVKFFDDILAIRGRLNVDFGEADLEPGDAVGWSVGDNTFIIGLAVIL